MSAKTETENSGQQLSDDTVIEAMDSNTCVDTNQSQSHPSLLSLKREQQSVDNCESEESIIDSESKELMDIALNHPIMQILEKRMPPKAYETKKIFDWMVKFYQSKQTLTIPTNCCRHREELDCLRQQLNDSKSRLDYYSEVFSENQKEIESLNKRLETLSANNVIKDRLLEQKAETNHCLTVEIVTLKTELATFKSLVYDFADRIQAIQDSTGASVGLERGTTAANPLNTSPIVSIKSESVKSESVSD